MLKPVADWRMNMPARPRSLSSLICLLALMALALTACAAPAAVPPTTAPTEPPTATALPATAVVTTAQITPVPANIPVPATSAVLDGPEAITFDKDGNFYVSNCGTQSVIYKIDPLGQLTIYAGNGSSYGFSGDGGPARAADLSCPAGLA